MKRLPILVLAAAIAGAACDDTPVAPSNTAPTFTATLLPTNEVPPVTNADSSASGNVMITVFVTRDANGAVTAATFDFNAVMSGFPPNTNLTGAHIHNARAGANSGVVVSTGIATGDITLPNGSGSFIRAGIVPSAANLVQVQNMLNDPAGFYFNIHTSSNPGGAIRGQLVRIQ